jgi:hypothetical protein
LLNPVQESHTITETMDEELYEAVMDARKEWENINVNGTGDTESDGPLIEPCPTPQEVLQATLIIERYIEELNDPITCSLELLLAKFHCQVHLNHTRTMKEMTILDYFHCS